MCVNCTFAVNVLLSTSTSRSTAFCTCATSVEFSFILSSHFYGNNMYISEELSSFALAVDDCPLKVTSRTTSRTWETAKLITVRAT